ncbi:hypothetical protein Cyan10605_1571 [Cyanobacterium aponinum PCC 10605]|uniref:Uncharacterized protein n=1 Tax=Cyanobacterium aponinum (strain PCC 10605) TaxID=755178 RepID=K9Z556_CYAAP|nr:hypothetical protein Cyan10605_1571 [Cyanobacterium aponinum PCC 10605]
MQYCLNIFLLVGNNTHPTIFEAISTLIEVTLVN